jgi:quercetin dioxygenase-like cupin family protein
VIVTADEQAVPWSSYDEAIRYKALTSGLDGVPGVGYIEYAPGHSDSVHHHKVAELFIVDSGEMWLSDERYGPGSVVFIPANTDYAVRAGDEGVRYFRVVTTP